MREKILSSSFRYRQQDPDYRGEKIDFDYTQDPVEKRPCTDMLCCIIFIVFLIGVGYIAVIAFKQGNIELLAAPFDEDKNQCGVDKGFEQYKKVYISNLIKDIKNVSFVCVKQCPNNSTQLLCHNNTIIKNCNQLNLYDTSTVVNICVPKVGVDFDFQYFNISVLQEYFSDLRDAKFLVLSMFGIALIISIIYTLLMRWFAGCFLWTFIAIFITLLIVVGSVALLMPQIQFLRDFLSYDELPENLRNRNYQIVCGSLCLGSALLTLIIVCCMKRQIQISIGIIKAASDFVRNCCSALLIPLYVSILQVIFISFWAMVMLHLFSSSNDMQPIDKTPFSMIVWNEQVQKLTIAYIFALIWIVFFFQGLGAYWTSSTVAIWYFQSGQPSSPIIRSVCRSLKNLGSIAFGSFLLTVVTVIRIVLQFINNKAKKSAMGMNDGQAAAVNFITKCAACLVACFERVIRFLTENAYIMMAISGKSFCSSARQSFYLLIRCAGQFAISHSTTKFFMGLGKMFILTLCCVIGYIIITTRQPFKSEIYEPIFLTIIFAIVSFPIASAFMNLFEMAANTMLVCYCIEIDLAKGRSRCPQGLKNFIEQYIQSSSMMDQIQNNRR